MKLSTRRLGLLLALSAAVTTAACSADSGSEETAEAEDDLTSLTARSRTLKFAGYVYVPEGADDAMVLAEVKAQTQSAFGALNAAHIAVQSRELGDVDPSTFLKTPVEIVDRASPDLPAMTTRRMTRVSYTFTDVAVVPVTLAERSAVSLALLGKAYQTQAARVVSECTKNDKLAHDFQHAVWYVFDPSVDACKKAVAAEQQKIDGDRKGLSDTQVPGSEIDRLYVPMTARLVWRKQATVARYPEYDRLFSGEGVEPGKLVIGMVNGTLADWAAGEVHAASEDVGYPMWFAGLREIFTARPGLVLTGVEGIVDPLDYNVNGKKVSFASFDEMIAFELDQKLPAGVAIEDSEVLRSQIAATIAHHWVTFETPVDVTIGGVTKPLVIKLQTYFGAETDPTPHKRAIKTSDIFTYNGHSYIGYGPLDPSHFTAEDFPPTYQVFNMNGCVSYNYYNRDYLPLKPGGTKNLDLVTNGLESWVNESGASTGRFVGALIDGNLNSYEAILTASQFTYYGYDWGMDALRVVDGELDNRFKPRLKPIAITSASAR